MTIWSLWGQRWPPCTAPGWCLGSGELCFSRGPQDLFPLTARYCKLLSSHCSEQKQLSSTAVTHLEHSTCEKCADPLPPSFQLGISTPAVQAQGRAAGPELLPPGHRSRRGSPCAHYLFSTPGRALRESWCWWERPWALWSLRAHRGQKLARACARSSLRGHLGGCCLGSGAGAVRGWFVCPHSSSLSFRHPPLAVLHGYVRKWPLVIRERTVLVISRVAWGILCSSIFLHKE